MNCSDNKENSINNLLAKIKGQRIKYFYIKLE